MEKSKLSRRDFLAGAALTSGAFLVGCSAGGEKNSAAAEAAGAAATATQGADSSIYAPAGFKPVSSSMTPTTLSALRESFRQLGVKHLHILNADSIDKDNCCAAYAFTDCIDGNPYDGNVFVVLASKAHVPNIIGMQPTEATQALTEAGFTADPYITTHATNVQDTMPHMPVVTMSSKEPGSLVAVGTTITLEYSESLDGWS